MAAFSAFVRITPETQSKYDFDVEIKNIGNDKYRFRIGHEYLCEGHKCVWLIISNKPVSPEKQNFRNYIWSSEKEKQLTLTKTKLQCKKNKDSCQSKHLEGILEKEKAARAYIYIDYPKFIFDGGYYYCVDLNTYQSQIISENANKQI